MERLADRFARHGLPLAVLVLIFLVGALQSLGLPGIYMDAANPDYLAAQLFNPEINNPSNRLPDWGWPILGGLYHGAQTTYLAWISFGLWGISLESLRLGHLLIGLAIITTFYATTVRITASRAAAFVVATALATDIALLSSLRTQFYIVLSGAPWLLLALYFIWPTQRRALLAGVCLGLAIYSYFVFAFFLPVFLVALLATTAGRAVVVRFVLGLTVGGGLYLLGYLALFSRLGGWTEGLVYLQSALGGLDPLSSTLTPADRLSNACRNLVLALTGTGNELMMFHTPVPSPWSVWASLKLWILGGAAVFALWVSRTHRPSAWTARWLLALGMLYFLVSASLGNRLWIHHASVYLPIAYLLWSFAVAQGLQWVNQVAPMESVFSPRPVALALALVLVFANLGQQHSFFNQLNRTGGLDRFSSAMTPFAQERLAHGPQQRVVFLDWGFLAGFVINTQNRIPFSTEFSLEQVRSELNAGHSVVVVAWKRESLDALAEQLRTLPIGPQQSPVAHLSRDGTTSFFELRLRNHPGNLEAGGAVPVR